MVARSQDPKPDTAFVGAATTYAKNLYTQVMQGESELYNGTDYPEYIHLRLNQDPFFKVNDWTDGWVLYGGELYDNVPILYDICRDKVVIEHYYNHSMIELLDLNVKKFSLLNHTFVRLIPTEGSNIKTGYYELLHDGKTSSYARWEKLLEDEIRANQATHYFSEKIKYYIYKDGVYYLVKNKASVLKVLEDQKRDLRHFLREKEIDFNQDRGKAIALMTEFYDSNKQ